MYTTKRRPVGTTEGVGRRTRNNAKTKEDNYKDYTINIKTSGASDFGSTNFTTGGRPQYTATSQRQTNKNNIFSNAQSSYNTLSANKIAGNVTPVTATAEYVGEFLAESVPSDAVASKLKQLKETRRRTFDIRNKLRARSRIDTEVSGIG